MRDGSSPIGVLLVTADSSAGAELRTGLERCGIDRTLSVGSARGALTLLHENDWIDCVVCDHSLPDVDGIALLQTVRSWAPRLPFVLFTGEGSESVASDAISAGVTDYLIAEPDVDQAESLSAMITDAVAYYRRHADVVDPEIQIRSVLDAAPDALLISQGGTVVYANPRLEELLDEPGLADGDPGAPPAAGTPLEAVLSFEGELTASSLTAVEDGGPVLEAHDEDLGLEDGSCLPVEVTVARIEWNGEPAVLIFLRDVSEQRGRQADLTLKNRAMNSTPVGVSIAEPTDGTDNPLIYVNDAYTEMTGYDREEVLGRDCRFLQGEETDPESVAEIARSIDADEAITTELLNYRKDGTPFWNRLTVAPIDPAEGEDPYYVGFQEDVTAEHERDQDLRRFRRAVESAGQAIFITDVDGTITYVNPAFETITGYGREEAIGRTPKILQSGQHDDDHYDCLWETIRSGSVWDGEIVDKRRSGERYYAHQTVAPLLGENGEIEEFVAVQSDITERKEREQQLHTLDRVLRHNLRTELNVIWGHANAIASETDGDHDDHVTAILESVTDLLEAAERGRQITRILVDPPRRRAVDVGTIVERVVAERREQYPDATVETALPEGATALAVERIGEAISELVTNAIGHNPSEEPTVTVRVLVDGERVRIEVEDDGPGIPEVERQVLGEATQQDALFHGSGLGLWSVYWLVRRSEGHLEFDERDPHGSVVTIVLKRPDVLGETG